MAPAWEFIKPFVEDGKEDTLLKIIEDNGLLAMPQVKAMLTNTISLNSLHSGDKVNVIPSYAEAEVDTRLLPGQGINAWIEMLKHQMDDDEVKIEFIMKGEGNSSDMSTDSYRIIEQALLDYYPGAIGAPYLMLGTTDSRFFRGLGMLSYGFCPAIIPADHLKSIHGIDEKIAVESVIKGTEVYKDIVKRLCT
jgi:carboxypeptidase PM20D1